MRNETFGRGVSFTPATTETPGSGAASDWQKRQNRRQRAVARALQREELADRTRQVAEHARHAVTDRRWDVGAAQRAGNSVEKNQKLDATRGAVTELLKRQGRYT